MLKKKAQLFRRVMNIIAVNNLMKKLKVTDMGKKLAAAYTIAGGALLEDLFGDRPEVVKKIFDEAKGWER